MGYRTDALLLRPAPTETDTELLQHFGDQNLLLNRGTATKGFFFAYPGCLLAARHPDWALFYADLANHFFHRDPPHLDRILEKAPSVLANGGSCIAGPDGNWIVEPVIDREELIIASLNVKRVLEERQNFDPSGHYARPDVTRLTVNRERQSVLNLQDNDDEE